MKKIICSLLLLSLWITMPAFTYKNASAKKNVAEHAPGQKNVSAQKNGLLPGSAPIGIDPDLLHFFTGHWVGAGEFAGGGKISADVSFALSLDSCWLVYEHRDRLPNKYKATSFWGVDGQTGQFVAYTLDNFHGHRDWVSNGWKSGKLILSTHGFSNQMGYYFEHFIYEKLSDNSFKMTYEWSGDGISWKLGDYLIFTRQES